MTKSCKCMYSSSECNLINRQIALFACDSASRHFSCKIFTSVWFVIQFCYLASASTQASPRQWCGTLYAAFYCWLFLRSVYSICMERLFLQSKNKSARATGLFAAFYPCVLCYTLRTLSALLRWVSSSFIGLQQVRAVASCMWSQCWLTGLHFANNCSIFSYTEQHHTNFTRARRVCSTNWWFFIFGHCFAGHKSM